MSKTPIKTDGYCINTLIGRLKTQIGDKAAEQLKQTAVEIVQNCVDVYSKNFGEGDVGATGTGLVSQPYKGTKEQEIPYGTTGLIYGRVQSGKTNTTIATLAIAQENKFRCFIVLTSDNTWLEKKTAARFNNQLKGGPVVFNWEEWKNPEDFVKNKLIHYIKDTGVVLVSTKNVRHLENLFKVIKYAKANTVPCLIFDDQADNASLNTNEAKQAKEAKETVPDSTTFENIGEIRKVVANHIYIQITATPQSLLLQNLDHPCKPAFCAAVPKPGNSYMGEDLFFREAIGDDPNNIKIQPVWVGPKLEPTRSCVLDSAKIDAFIPGTYIFPPAPLYKASDVKAETERLNKLLADFTKNDEYYEVDIDFLIEIISHTHSNYVSGGKWEDKRVQKALGEMKANGIQKGRLNVRRGTRGQGLRLTRQDPSHWIRYGFATSEWITKPKREYPSVPTLLMMYEKGEKQKGWDNQPLYLPMLILPISKFVLMFNYADETEEIEDDLEWDDSEEIDEQEWLHVAANNRVFAFLHDPEEDIYTLADGKPFND